MEEFVRRIFEFEWKKSNHISFLSTFNRKDAWNVVLNRRHANCNASVPRRRSIGGNYFNLVYIGVLVLGLGVFKLMYNQSYLLKVSSVLRSEYNWECTFDNTIIFILFKFYLHLLFSNYLLLPVIYQSLFYTLLTFPPFIFLKNTLSKHSLLKDTVEVFIFYIKF